MPWVAATEEEATVRGGWTKRITLNPGVRLFRVSDQLAASALLDWSEPVQLKLQKREDETYELVARKQVTRDSKVSSPVSDSDRSGGRE